jgi:hypothetical protein
MGIGSFVIGAGAGALVIWWLMRRRCGNPFDMLSRDKIQEVIFDPFSGSTVGNYPAAYRVKMY